MYREQTVQTQIRLLLKEESDLVYTVCWEFFISTEHQLVKSTLIKFLDFFKF